MSLGDASRGSSWEASPTTLLVSRLPHRLAAFFGTLGPALAQLTPLSPFVGVHREGFETQAAAVGGPHAGPGFCLSGEVLGGLSNLCTPGFATCDVLPGSGCGLAPHGGAYLFTCGGTGAQLEFTLPVRRFGARLAIGQQISGPLQVTFREPGGGIVGVGSWVPGAACTWVWAGWESDVAFTRVDVAVPAGIELFLDDLEVSTQPTLGSGIGVVTCPSNPNSTGRVGRLQAYGSPFPVDGDLTLLASDLPPDRFGYFLSGRVPGLVVQPGGSQGNLCLGLPFGRWSSDVRNSGPAGEFTLALDLAHMPNASPAAVLPGETWTFQAWYRDSNPGPTDNLTEAVAVTFL